MERVLPPRLLLSQFTLALDRLHISRTCTVHQLEALITERIPSALNTYAARILIASGFLHNFYDENVALREAWRIFRKAVAHLRALANAGTLVLAVCPTPAARDEPGRTMRFPDRDGLLKALIAEADKVITLDVSTTSTTLSAGLSLEKPIKTVRALRVISPAELPNLDTRESKTSTFPAIRSRCGRARVIRIDIRCFRQS